MDGENHSSAGPSIAGPSIDGSPTPARIPGRRHLAFFGASVAAHVAAFAAILWLAPSIAHPHSEWVLAYLVEIGGGSSGNVAGSSEEGPANARVHAGLAPIPAVRTTPSRMYLPSGAHHHRSYSADTAKPRIDATALVARAKPNSSGPSASASAVRSVAGPDAKTDANAGAARAAIDLNSGGAGASRIGAGAGEGLGVGSGTSLASADYGQNPSPPYPDRSRRRDEQGTVTLHVLVGEDGSVERVELAESSGFDSLDRSALDTVRRKWRFVPARRDGVAMESWVLVPIRFSLKEANAAR